LIDINLIASGGPPKDGIPSIDEPKFTTIESASPSINEETRGILLQVENEVKFYPYNILVWHEIVNDEVAGEHVAITFCPLCGTAIAYSREVNEEVLEFGVSGLLYQSNLLMYDRKTESLWSQVEGRAVVGDFAGTELELLPVQVLTFEDARSKHPSMRVLSADTGYSKDYSLDPYSGYYEDNDRFLFNVKYKGEGLPAKDLVYAVNYNETPVSFVVDKLKEQEFAELQIESETISATYSEGEIVVTDSSGNKIPGFYSMWFSWANHNLPEGVNPDANGVVWGIQGS
jgi:hypothetical protein